MTLFASAQTDAVSDRVHQWGVRARGALRLELWVWVAVIGVSIALSPLVSAQSYVVLGALTALIVLLVGGGLRAAGVPWAIVLLAQVVALTLWATIAFASEQATLGVLPNREVFAHLQSYLTATSEQAQKYAAPVPRLHALDVTLALAIGALTILTDLVAVSWRRAPLVGLIFLGVYVVPISVLSGDVGIWSFIPGALGYVFLLAAAEREYVVRWGKHLADLERTAAIPDTMLRGSGLAQTGRRLGMGAVACAVVLPAFIPTLPSHIFGPGGSGGGSGLGGRIDVNVDNPIVGLQRNLREQSRAELLRFKSNGASPSYVRLTSLPELTSFGWQPGQRGRDMIALGKKLPLSPGATNDMSGATTRFTVKISDRFHTQWLPVVYAPSKVRTEGVWRIDRRNLDIVAASRRYDSAGLSYSFTSRIDEPSVTQLQAAPEAGASLLSLLDLPADTPDVLRQRALEVTKGASTDYDKAIALQNWFRSSGGFVYDVTTRPGNGMDTMRDFVTTDRRGYCEQFASAMAIMARELRIPARVAIGFLRPETSGGSYIFRGTDMHAWPELYFEGAGWVRFEPTPGGPNYEPATFAQDSPNDALTPSAAPSATNAGERPDRARKEGSGQSGTGGGAAAAIRAHAWSYALLVVLVLLLLAVPLLLRRAITFLRWRRAEDPAAHAEAAWLELRDRTRDLGILWDDGATPRATGRALGHLLSGDPAARTALDRIVDQVEHARYARECEDVDLRNDVAVVASGLAAGRGRIRRLMADWLPLSWLRRRRAVEPSRWSAQPTTDHEELIALQE